jgi:hypothetical protein
MNERIFHLSGDEPIERLKEILDQCNADTVFFLFPRKSWIFRQNTDLQSLRNIADENQKELIIVTKNSTARKLIQSMGIGTLASLEDREKTPFEQQRGDFSAQKISYIPLESLEKIIKKRGEDREGVEEEKIKKNFSRPVLHSLFLLAILIISFFVFLLHVAIPSVSVKISPFKKEEEMHINVHMLSISHFEETDLWRENNGIFVYPLEEVFTLEKTFSSISKEFRGENATGEMKIVNTTPEELTFRSGTRLQNDKGIIFLLPDWVNIPAAKNGVDGTVLVDVVASETSKYNKFQGEDANMPKGQQFIFPALSVENQSKVFAENTTAMEGGKTEWVYKIAQQDVDLAKEKLIEEAKEIEKKEMEYSLLKRFEGENSEMIMLPLDGIHVERELLGITFDVPEEELVGQERTEFTGKIQIRVKNYVYSNSELLKIVEGKFRRSAPEGMELLKIDTRVINPEILSAKEKNTRLKVSFSTRGIYQYVIEPKSKRGVDFSERAKKAILGKNVEEAKKELINNFKEVSDAQIDLWPFWTTKIPLLPEKIQLEILDEEI